MGSPTTVDLERESRRLAEDLSNLLNGTACHGIRLRSVISVDSGSAWVGYRPASNQLVELQGIPLTIGRAVPRCWLGLSFRLDIDEFGQHLMVTSSYLGVYCDAALERELLHYDYERDKPDNYPEAHLQIPASSPHWSYLLSQCLDAKNELEHLHLPTGGRRFRPTVEDVLEFLMVERIIDARDGWHDVLNDSRNAFRARQLRAAVRRHPEIAASQLANMGYRVELSMR